MRTPGMYSPYHQCQLSMRQQQRSYYESLQNDYLQREHWLTNLMSKLGGSGLRLTSKQDEPCLYCGRRWRESTGVTSCPGCGAPK